ncbi:MAG: glycosyltransferase family 39 protein [Anaerolineae bacterium]|nr:glycosyltransferase family 39 protein [Anaerolineae bacterium]
MVKTVPQSPFYKIGVLMLISVFVLIGFGVRIKSIDYGLPYPYHIDELQYSYDTWNFVCTGNFRTPLLQPQTYTVAVVIGVSQVLPGAPPCERITNLPPVFSLVAARVVSVLFGALTIAVVFRLGRRLYGPPVGMVGAFLVTFNFLHVRESHYGTPDVVGVFLVLAALLAYTRIARWRTLRNYILAATLTALAISNRLTFALLLLPFAYVHFYPFLVGRKLSWAKLRPYIFHRWVLIAVLVLAGVFIVLTPLLIFEPRNYARYWGAFFRLGRLGGFGRFAMDPLSAPIFYLQSLLWAVGWLQTAVFALGFVWAVWRRRLPDVMLLSFGVLYYLVAARANVYFARYIIPFSVIASILAARAVWEAAVSLRLKSTYAVAAVAILLVIQPLISIAFYNQLIDRTDTRTLAREWIDANIPDGTKMATEFHTPYLEPGKYNVTEVDVHGLWQTDYQIYVDQRFEYLIVSGFIRDATMLVAEEEEAKKAFYSYLDQAAEYVKTFSPYEGASRPPFRMDLILGPIAELDQYQRPGPLIRIYRLRYNNTQPR